MPSPKPPTLLVRFRGTVYELPVCYSEDACAELLARWPDGVIELAKIFEHASPSSEMARAFVVRATLALAGEPMPPDPLFDALRFGAKQARADRVALAKAHLATL